MINESLTTRRRLTLLKIRGGGEAEFTIVERRVHSLLLHWVGKRSCVCPGEGCEVCGDWPPRWAGFVVVSVRQGGGWRRLLLELTASTFDRLDGLRRMEGWPDLLGVQCVAARSKQKSPLMVEPVSRLEEGMVKEPIRMNVWDAIATLYGLPSVRDGESETEWAERCTGACVRMLDLAIAALEPGVKR